MGDSIPGFWDCDQSRRETPNRQSPPSIPLQCTLEVDAEMPESLHRPKPQVFPDSPLLGLCLRAPGGRGVSSVVTNPRAGGHLWVSSSLNRSQGLTHDLWAVSPSSPRGSVLFRPPCSQNPPDIHNLTHPPVASWGVHYYGLHFPEEETEVPGSLQPCLRPCISSY